MTSRIIFGSILIVLGISVLTGLSLMNFLIAALLVYFGLRLIMGKAPRWSNEVGVSPSETINEVAIFSPFHRKVISSVFRGGKIVLVFSGGEVDLREVHTLLNTVELEVVGVASGLKVIIPKDWGVEQRGVAILGGYTNRAEGGGSTKLLLTGTAVLSGVEIVN